MLRLVRAASYAILLALLASPAMPAAHGASAPTGRGANAVSGMLSATSAGACSDGTYSVASSKWKKSYNWQFDAATTPGNLSVSAVESALQTAVNRMTTGFNNCGLADQISATASYAGRTSLFPNINSSGACLSPDGRSEIGFGSLPSGTVGMTCWWSVAGEIVESDVVFSKNVKWYLSKPASCSAQWSLYATAAHELGHAFGLNHVAETTHGSLTMAPKIMACQSGEATLGLGDVRGLEALY